MTTLLGRTTAGTTADFTGSSETAVWKFTALVSGTLAVIKAQTKVANTASAVRFGIYSDNAGAPNALLSVQAADVLATANGTGVATATLSTPVSIAAGTDYWLGWRGAGDPRNFQGDSAGAYRETQAGQDFPSTWPGVSGTGNVNAIIWGEDAGGGALLGRMLAALGVG